MLKIKLSHSKVYFDACSCGNTLDCSSSKLTISKQTQQLRKYTTENGTRVPNQDFTKRIPKGHWKEQTNQRKFFDDLGEKIGIQTPDDWYQKLSKKVFSQYGGVGFLAMYKNSPIAALMTAYPEHNWVPWKFKQGHQGYWSDIENQRKFFDDLGSKLGVKKKEDWYQKLSAEAIIDHGGAGLLTKHKYLPIATLMAAYPEHSWDPWKFKQAHQRTWGHSENRKFFDDLGRKLGVDTMDDWYHKLSAEVITDHGGVGLLTQHKGSPIAALMSSYPEHKWIPWKFNNIPRNFWKEQSNIRYFFDTLGKEIGVQTLHDWYPKLSKKIISQNGGDGLLVAHNSSPIAALMVAYPEHNWVTPKFNNVNRGYWDITANQRKFFDDLGLKLGIHKLDDWYHKISFDVVIANGGTGVLSKHKNSPLRAVMAAYPEHNWDLTKFKKTPQAYWNSPENQKKFFDDLGLKLGVEKMDDWYQKLSAKAIVEHGGVSLLSKASPMTSLMSVYPQHTWDSTKFKHVHQGNWGNTENQKKFFDDLGLKLGVEKMDDWYHKLSAKVVTEHGGASLLDKHRGAVAALMASYPEHKWTMWKFNTVPRSFWKEPSNVRKFFDSLGKEIGIQTLDDWYKKLSHDIITDKGGATLLKANRGSPLKTLMAAYPEHNWVPWKFNNVSRRFWNSSDNVKGVVSELSEKLSIQTLDDWYRVDWVQLRVLGASSLPIKYKGLYNLLKEQYPDHPWDPKKFQQSGKKAQRWLAVTVQKMFPDEDVLEDYMHPKATFATSNRPLQLDVFVPSRSLAFEYQGAHHYEEVGLFGPSKMHQKRDEEKRILCAANNIQLIEVPYWWNRTHESLQDIMKQAGQ